VKSIFTDFSAGELSEKVKGRFDLPAYRKGCLTLENMFVTSTGMVTKRPGTKYVGSCRGLTNAPRILPFVYSDTESYLVELIAGAVQVWRGGAVVASSTSPTWSAAEIWDIQYVQDHRGIYMVHPSHAPVSLIRTATDTFTYSSINFLYFLGGTLTSHDTKNTIGLTTLEATANVSTLGAAVNQQGQLRVKHATGQYDDYTYTSYTGAIFSGLSPALARTYDNTDSIIVAQMYDSDNGSSVPFAGASNYPRAISIFAGRFWFGGSNLDRQRIWASAAYGDTVDTGQLYLDMRMQKILISRRTEQKPSDTPWTAADEPETETVIYTRAVISDDVGIQIDIASDQNDAILWMAPGRDLFVGTTAAEWVIPRAVTARSPQATLESRAGSSDIQPHYVWDIMPFLQSSKKQVRAYRYTEEGGGYKPPELTRTADHILGATGAVEYDVQKEPRCMVYFPRLDGQMAALTYEPDAGVLAWQRFLHSDATFTSVAVIPESGEEAVYVTVKRGTSYYLEKFADAFPAAQANIQYMDSLYDITADDLSLNAGSGTFQGCTWLASLTITVVEDGIVAGTESVDASGDVDLSAYTGSQVYIGLPFTHKLETMPISQMLEGPLPLDDKRIVRAIIRLYKSLTLKVIHDSWTVADADDYSLGTAWISDSVEVGFPGDVDKDATLRIVGTDAYPLSIQAITLEIDVGDQG